LLVRERLEQFPIIRKTRHERQCISWFVHALNVFSPTRRLHCSNRLENVLTTLFEIYELLRSVNGIASFARSYGCAEYPFMKLAHSIMVWLTFSHSNILSGDGGVGCASPSMVLTAFR
jgi:hypothetical protein